MIDIADLDVIFLSYNEPNKEHNWADLRSKCPWAKRVDGVEGSDAAHKAAGEASSTERFILIDGDNIVNPALFDQQLDIDNIVDETQQLINIKNSASPLTKLMNRLTQLIPNDTWLTHFKYKDSKLQIQGQSPSASVLIGVLEESVLFSNARFVSPLTQDKRTGMERFKISMDVNVPEDNVGE